MHTFAGSEDEGLVAMETRMRRRIGKMRKMKETPPPHRQLRLLPQACPSRVKLRHRISTLLTTPMLSQKPPPFAACHPRKSLLIFMHRNSSFTSSASLIQNQFGPESSQLIPMPLSLTCMVKSPSPSLPSRLLGTSR